MKCVDYFNEVRDLPYRHAVGINQEDMTSFEKHAILMPRLRSLGLDVRPKVFETRWSFANIPKKIKSIPHDDEILHSYLEVKVGSLWKVVDATFDKKLSPYLYSADWNGVNDTPFAMRRIGMKEYSLARSLEIFPNGHGLLLSHQRDFYSALNSWMEGLRQKYSK